MFFVKVLCQLIYMYTIIKKDKVKVIVNVSAEYTVYLLGKQQQKLSQYYHRNVESNHVQRSASGYQLHLWLQHQQMDTNPQKSKKRIMHESSLRLKFFWGEKLSKLQYFKFKRIPFSCSAYHQSMFLSPLIFGVHVNL